MDVLTFILWTIIVLVPTVYLYFTKKYSYWKDRGVPHLETKIPFGTKQNLSDFRADLERHYAKRGQFPFVGGYTFTAPVVVVTDLDFAKTILIRDFSHFTDHGIFYNEKDDPLSASLFSLGGHKWKVLRAKLSPTFTSGRMKFMFPTVIEVADRFNETLSELVKTENTLEIKDLLARFTTDIIGTCAFGIECNSLKDPNAEFRKYGRKHIEVPRHYRIVTLLLLAFPNLAKKLHMVRTHNDVSDFFMGIVRDTVSYREKNNVRRNDFMNLLIQLKNNAKLEGDDSEGKGTKIMEKLTIEELAAQAFIFFVGGFETSSSTLTFTLYEMAINQDIQDKCRDEINQVLKKYNGELTYEAMNEMTYVEQTVLETLRKYPILTFIMRECVSDYQVTGTNVTIEKGTSIQIPVYSIQHDPEYYPDPEKFDPDRFSPENVKSRHPMTFLSFGDGPRNCIGLRFGKMQSRVGLITLLKNYRITKSAKTPVPLELSNKSLLLSIEGGMFLNFEKLNKNTLSAF